MELSNDEEIKNLQSYTWFFGSSVEKINNLKKLLDNSKLLPENVEDIMYRINELLLAINELTKNIQTLTYDFIKDIYYLKQNNQEYYKLIISAYLDNFLALYSSLLDLIVNKINNVLFKNKYYDSYGKMIKNQNKLSKEEKEIYDYLIIFNNSIDEVRDPRNFSIHRGVIKLSIAFEDRSNFQSPLLNCQFNVIHRNANDYLINTDWFYSVSAISRIKFYQLLTIIENVFKKLQK